MCTHGPHRPTRVNPTTYFWRGKRNFGDLLGPLLLGYFAGVECEWSPADRAEVVSVGSILEHLPVGYRGIIAGAGFLYEHRDRYRLKDATVLGLRGPLSARGVRGDFCLGDPGLLANQLANPDKEFNLGLVPHWSDERLEHRFKEFKPLIIRPEQNPLDVIRQIGSCRKIVASSLHGIIVADSFTIPRRIELTPRFDAEGGDFKFRDHNAAVGVPHEIGLTQEAPRHKVANRQYELVDMLEHVGLLMTGGM